ncbi:hypothetical protein SUGI_0362050 [Cryptomeria japonica]|nr:hypothetical protein SUGI_0362050 [Cryptomeria japonica]
MGRIVNTMDRSVVKKLIILLLLVICILNVSARRNLDTHVSNNNYNAKFIPRVDTTQCASHRSCVGDIPEKGCCHPKNKAYKSTP